MENNEVVIIFDYENQIDWDDFPNKYMKINKSFFVLPKYRLAEIAFIIKDFKLDGKKVTVII